MNYTKEIILAAILISTLVLVVSFKGQESKFGNLQGQNNTFYSVGTSSTETVPTTNVVVLATSTGRTWARIANVSANPILCTYANSAPAVSGGTPKGFIIAASSTFEMNGLAEPVFTGGINCISDTAASAQIYVEANQQ